MGICLSKSVGQTLPFSSQNQYNQYHGCGHDYTNYDLMNQRFQEAPSHEASVWVAYYEELISQEQSIGGDWTKYLSWYEYWSARHSAESRDIRDSIIFKHIPEHGLKSADKDVNSRSNIEDERRSGEQSLEQIELNVANRWQLARRHTLTFTNEEMVRDKFSTILSVEVLETRRNPRSPFVPCPEFEGVYCDPDFPPSKALGKYSNTYSLKRPNEIYSDIPTMLFHDGSSVDDIFQGQFGTCYLLSVLSSLAAIPRAMRQIIPKDAYDAQRGLFHCRFWQFGSWLDVYIDDTLPCDDRGITGASSGNYKGELWMSFMEKAWAKFIGSYPDAEAGTTRFAFLSLTGGVAEYLPGTSLEPEKFFSRLANLMNHGGVVLSSCHNTEDKWITDSGIITSHAYNMTASALVPYEGQLLQLIKLRNPWAHKEWNGPWGDKSSTWEGIEPELKDLLLTVQEDGEFWMSVKEAFNVFTDYTVGNFSPDYDLDGISDGLTNVFAIYGEWYGMTAGGEKKLTTYKNNPKYEFYIPDKNNSEETWVVVELMQYQAHRREEVKYTKTDLYRLSEESRGNVDKLILVDDYSGYRKAPVITLRYSLPSGHYVLIPSTKKAGLEKEFLIRVFSKDHVTFRMYTREFKLI